METVENIDNVETETVRDDGVPGIVYRFSEHDKAIFHLGQIDMRESAADMLEVVSRGTENEIVSAALLQAAALVRDMKITGGG